MFSYRSRFEIGASATTALCLFLVAMLSLTQNLALAPSPIGSTETT